MITMLTIISWLNLFFQQEFLKPFDHDDGTIITAYQVGKSFADQIRDHFQPKKLENVLNNLSEDNNGNIVLHIQLKEDHFITLNYKQHWGCNVEISKTDSIENLALSYKEKLVCNIVTNVIDQSQKDFLVELASVFDLLRPLSLDKCINYLKTLHTFVWNKLTLYSWYWTNWRVGSLPHQHPLQMQNWIYWGRNVERAAKYMAYI